MKHSDSNNKNANANELYSDRNPKTTIKGFGFANREKARETIDKLKKGKFSKKYKKQVLVTMYYRAKHHPHQTAAMRFAMREFKKGNRELGLGVVLD
jgi:hypothetical protein